MKLKICLIAFLSIVLFLIPFTAWTQDNPDLNDLGARIGALVKDRQLDAIDDLLMGLESDESRAFAEKYILDKAREFVLASDLDYAQALAEIVLLFNLDNAEAQNLYAGIENAQREKVELAEKQRLAEEEKKRREEEAKRLEAEKKAEDARLAEEKRLGEEKAAEKEAYEKAVSEVGLQNLSGFFSVSPAYFAIQQSGFYDIIAGSETVHSGYGLQGAGYLRFSHPYIEITLNLLYDHLFVSFNDGDLLDTFSITGIISTPLLHFPLALRAGFAGMFFTSADGGAGTTTLFTAWNSLAVGIGLENLKIGKSIALNAGVDLYTFFLSEDLVDLAMGAEISAVIRLFSFGKKLDFVLYPLVRASLVSSDSTLEWTLNPSLAAGVIINDQK
ncbi:MAG: hypothetical protein JW874_08600 [Spirochaetales bacterium]|nr:hypothetical protein [Spirochaetales bacterium]